MSYRVIPIDGEKVAAVRNDLVSPQYKSLAANVSLANGYGPCRSCLRVFGQGTDQRVYFTYNSFEGRSTLPDPGPVFIHLDECSEFGGNSFPPDLLDLPVLLEAFGDDSRLMSRHHLDRGHVDVQIGEIFRDDAVRFINLRNAEAGCFIATVERA